MQYRTFGRTGWSVSEIAFGGWQLGGDWGVVDDDASIRTLHHSLDRGINFVDTASFTGLVTARRSSVERCAAGPVIGSTWRRRCSRRCGLIRPTMIPRCAAAIRAGTFARRLSKP